MHNYDRRLAYAGQRFGCDAAEAGERVELALAAGTEDALLTGPQRRRSKHHRGQPGGHRQRQRARRRAEFLKRLARFSPYAVPAEPEQDDDQPES